MIAVRIVTLTLTIVMFGAIAVSIATGDIGEEGRLLLDSPWGRMSLIDLYVGVILIAGWAFLREANPWVAVLWLPVFVVLGHGGTALYATVAAFGSDDIRTFLLGTRA
jgi:hypothetical protein